MKIEQMMTELGNRFGKANLRINTEFHFQVIDGRKIHDIWRGKAGLKWKLSGMAHTQSGAPEKLLQALQKHNGSETDLSKIQAAVELCRVIDKASSALAGIKVTRAVYCDAGFKEGRARIGVVLIDGEYLKAERKTVQARDINEAEEIAIEHGSAQAEEYEAYNIQCAGKSLSIYSDSQTVVNRLAARRPAGDRKILWIGRGLNKVADKVANLRDAKGG